MHDLVIRDASIVDGTGAPGYRGSVAIDGTRIAAVGLVPDRGTREIDAGGRVVCPGFIDVHTHSDLMLLA
ncbi:MAG: amidohydrolase family protein, partial [Chloroflexi bacterium]|nr:amidohydrolase family protein [Chloroflexota bacterium]